MVSRTEKHTDVVIVGFGWVGAIMARELTQAGLNVVALERGPRRDTWPEGAYVFAFSRFFVFSEHNCPYSYLFMLIVMWVAAL